MIHDLLMQIILMIVVIVVPFLANETFKWIKAKSKNENFKHFLDLAMVGVKAAEQQMGAGTGALKKKQVELYLTTKLKWVTPEDINHVIDATVSEINKTKKELEKGVE